MISLLCTTAALTLIAAPPGDKYTFDLPGQLQTGSQLGAGVDPAATSEIVHPANLSATAASLRQLAGVLRGANTSATVQLNPYMLFTQKPELYDAIVGRRELLFPRLAQDSALTITASSGSPYPAPENGNRFATLGVGASVELLGTRSVFSSAFSGCLDEQERKSQEAEIFKTKPPQPNVILVERKKRELDQLTTKLKATPAGDPQLENAVKAAESELLEAQSKLRDAQQRYEQFKKDYAALVQRELEECKRSQLLSGSALFLSYGTRWVVPGVERQEGDRVQVQRQFGALAWEFFLASGLEITAQARVLANRERRDALMAIVSDAGLQAKWSSPRLAWALEATQSFAKLSADNHVAAIATWFKLKLTDAFGISIGLQGIGSDIGDALRSFTGSVAVSLHEKLIFERALPLGS